MKISKKLLERVERKIDEVNGDYGSKEEYCIFCKSTKYNGKKGIDHGPDCIIEGIRRELNIERMRIRDLD